MSEQQPVKSSIDWKKIRDERVPEVPADDPALARVRAQLEWLENHPAPEGNDPLSGKSFAELHQELRQSILDEIERYRWMKAGFSVTPEMLGSLRDKP